MNITKTENELFSQWKNYIAGCGENADTFVPDGMASNAYLEAPVRILFFFKEAYGGPFDLRNLLKNGASRKGEDDDLTWPNIARWVYMLFQPETPTWDTPLEDEQYVLQLKRKYLPFISVVNIKKINGISNSKNKDLNDHFKRDRIFLNTQLNLYQPDLIICGGTASWYEKLDIPRKREHLESENVNVWLETDAGGRKNLVFYCYHPQAYELKSQHTSNKSAFEEIRERWIKYRRLISH